MVNGRLFDAATMHETGPTPRERAPFWWQREGVDDGFVWMPESHTFEGGMQCVCGRH